MKKVNINKLHGVSKDFFNYVRQNIIEYSLSGKELLTCFYCGGGGLDIVVSGDSCSHCSGSGIIVRSVKK